MLIVFRLLSYLSQLFHKFSFFLQIFFFKKIIFNLIEIFTIEFLCNLILITVYLCVYAFIDLLANSLLRNILKSWNNTLRDLLIIDFLDRVDYTIRMKLFYHSKISAFNFHICEQTGINSLRKAKDLIIPAFWHFIAKLFSYLRRWEQTFYLGV